jgi:O-methyltransferase
MSWKRSLVALAKRFGWHLSRNGLVRLDAPDGYQPAWPHASRVYAPWTQAPFARLLESIEPWTLVSPDRCYVLRQFAMQCAHLKGDFAECGVYKGGTALLSARTLRDAGVPDKLLHLFDTFEGMPEEAARDHGGHLPGQFGDTSLAGVQSRLREYPNVRFHPGLIPETLAEVQDREFAFVYLDLDLYQATLEALRFFYPRLVPGGVLIGDDYGFPRYRYAARQAVDEFFSDKPEPLIALHTGQCLAIKLPREP